MRNIMTVILMLPSYADVFELATIEARSKWLSKAFQCVIDKDFEASVLLDIITDPALGLQFMRRKHFVVHFGQPWVLSMWHTSLLVPHGAPPIFGKNMKQPYGGIRIT